MLQWLPLWLLLHLFAGMSEHDSKLVASVEQQPDLCLQSAY
jgi:hypothetical protein